MLTNVWRKAKKNPQQHLRIIFQYSATIIPLWTFLVPKAAIKILVKIAKIFFIFLKYLLRLIILQHIMNYEILVFSSSENDEKSSNYTFKNGRFWNQKCSQCILISSWTSRILKDYTSWMQICCSTLTPMKMNILQMRFTKSHYFPEGGFSNAPPPLHQKGLICKR